MEIKLTADWILLHNGDVCVMEGKGCFCVSDNSFVKNLIELSLKTLNVKYKCEIEDSYYENEKQPPIYYYSLDNIDDIKETCPGLYAEFQKIIKFQTEWNEKWKKKLDIVLRFLDAPKTQKQIHNHLVIEVYKKDNDFDPKIKWFENHTGAIINDLLKNGLICKISKKYTLV